MPEATSKNCCNALITAWISRFGLPDSAVTDNGTTFMAKLWADLHKNLGTLVTYSPTYHPSTMGHIERVHRDIKVGLKAALIQMGDKHQQAWTQVLPWLLLSKRTAYQPALGTSAAEMTFGQTLKVPGDFAGADLAGEEARDQLLSRLQTLAARTPIQTTHNTTIKSSRPIADEI